MAATPTSAGAPAVRQRLRGSSFKTEYQGAAAARRTVPGRPRAPSMSHDTSKYCIPEQEPGDRDKIVLVLDLDETLVFAREGPLYARPGLDEFFAMCKDRCEVVVWTAGLKAYAQAVIRTIDRGGVIKHCLRESTRAIFLGQAGYRKDLAALGRSLDKTIIIEYVPDCLRGYEQNGILIAEDSEHSDNTILALSEVVRTLCDSGMSVPQFVTTCPLLTKGPVQTDVGDYIQVYTLNVGLWKPGQHTRVNRDLGVRK